MMRHLPWSRSAAVPAAVGLLLFLLAPVAAAQNPFLRQGQERVITAIEISGNEHTQDYVLLRELGFSEGDVYDDDALNDAWFRLEQLDFIAYVDIEQERPADGEVVLKIRVEEDDRFDWRPTIDWSRRFDWRYGLGTKLIGFRGRAETLHADAWLGHQIHFDGGWRNPWILGDAHLGVALSGYWERYDFVYEPFEFEDRGGGILLWRDLPGKLRVSGGYTYRSTEIVDTAWPDIRPEGSTLDPYVTLGLEHDSRDIRYYPMKGLHLSLDGRFGGMGSDEVSAYSCYDLHGAGFYPVPYLGVVAGRMSFRLTDDPLPFYERSYLGGPDDLRGVDFSSVRGDQRYLATVEIRRPIVVVPLREGRTIGLGVHAFYDWGKAWEADQAFSDADLRHSGGFGLHLNLNTFNLRFEWAFSDEDGNSFVFGDTFTF